MMCSRTLSVFPNLARVLTSFMKMLAEAVALNPSDKALASVSLVYVFQEIHPLMDVAVDKADAHRLKDQLVL